MSPNNRLEDLRHRVQNDPASVAFAQLAEELRRAGQCEESVEVCRAGLGIHPAYLSARVTLGRALIDLNRLDEARQELVQVRKVAPENLAAIRALAEIHQRLPRSTFRDDEIETPVSVTAMIALVQEPGRPFEPHETVQTVPASSQETVCDVEAASAGSQEVLRPVEPTPAVREEPLVRQAEHTRGLRTVIALEQLLAAIHVARAHRNP